jgi:hypothetical protein
LNAEKQTPENEHAFYSFLRINLRTYTTLLEILQDDLVKVTRATAEMGEVELTNKILVASGRVLPTLRVYSCWLYQNYQLLLGLKSDPALATPIESFWKSYGSLRLILRFLTCLKRTLAHSGSNL